MAEAPFALVEPTLDRLDQYAAALGAGWSPNTTRDVSGEQLAAIGTDPAAFVTELTRREGGTVTLPDGRTVPRLPGRVLWMWDGGPDGAFCGAINLRHVPGTLDLPPHVSGHVGYAVVPWQRRRGVATRALALMLPVARALGLPRVLVTCDADNDASRRTIERNNGVPAGEADAPEHEGARNGVRKLLFWIDTGPA